MTAENSYPGYDPDEKLGSRSGIPAPNRAGDAETRQLVDKVREFGDAILVQGRKLRDADVEISRLRGLLAERRIWHVKVYQDGSDEVHDYYVPAGSKLDAQVLAFVLDGGLGDVPCKIEPGEVELAKMWTKVTGSVVGE